MAIRVAVFSVLGLGAIGVALAYTVTLDRGIEFDLTLAIIVPSAAIIFGSQRDIIQVWTFWQKPNPEDMRAANHSDELSTIISSRMSVSIVIEHPIPLARVYSADPDSARLPFSYPHAL
ncbi:hypothetical protein H0H81_006443 [Sphagnurus paluster]|uniref:Uncharacterized protein n=1 Tax=Sphagnurus paluster TaxID=117069 RepID=A0A9P7FRM7_9AGAR|nr:hypothetical protein H0H81_006443 [Sphagnurus paluster]